MPDCTFFERDDILLETAPTFKGNAAFSFDLDKNKLPQHIAIIPDGNRRWARQRALGVAKGHDKGADNVMTIVRTAKKLGIKHLTFYIFSTENWARETYEISALMYLLRRFLIKHREEMVSEGIRLHTIGDLSRLSKRLNSAIEESKKATENCTNIELILALNYGARDEIKRAVIKIAKEIKSNKISEQEIDEQLISKHLDTASWPDPDLLIRTSGEHRISNYLLWQLSYAELYVCSVLWPDFTPQHFYEAMVSFQTRERRHGGA